MGMLQFFDNIDSVTIDHTGTFIKWLDLTLDMEEDIYEGDKRSDLHVGLMTKNKEYIVLSHMTEHDALSHLPLTQAIALFTYLYDKVSSTIDRCNGRIGAHHGIAARYPLQVPVREYHCKYKHDIFWSATTNMDDILLKDYGDYINEDDILIKPNGDLYVMRDKQIIFTS